MVVFGKRSRGEWVKEINQQCVWFVQLNFATYVGVSFSKRKLIYGPINLGFHLLIARIVLYCFLLFTVYHCTCCNKRWFNLQVEKTFHTQAFDSIAESFSSDGFGRFCTWFILWIPWQNDSTKDSLMESNACV